MREGSIRSSCQRPNVAQECRNILVWLLSSSLQSGFKNVDICRVVLSEGVNELGKIGLLGYRERGIEVKGVFAQPKSEIIGPVIVGR